MEPCKHVNKLVPAEIIDARQGVIALVECKDCRMVIGNCTWKPEASDDPHKKVSRLVFSPDWLEKEMSKPASYDFYAGAMEELRRTASTTDSEPRGKV